MFKREIVEDEEIKQLNNQNDSQWDTTDAAHPAWWRGEKYGAYKAAELIKNILSGRETGKGAVNEPVNTMRQSVLDLKKERDNQIEKFKSISIWIYEIGECVGEIRGYLNKIEQAL